MKNLFINPVVTLSLFLLCFSLFAQDGSTVVQMLKVLCNENRSCIEKNYKIYQQCPNSQCQKMLSAKFTQKAAPQIIKQWCNDDTTCYNNFVNTLNACPNSACKSQGIQSLLAQIKQKEQPSESSSSYVPANRSTVQTQANSSTSTSAVNNQPAEATQNSSTSNKMASSINNFISKLENETQDCIQVTENLPYKESREYWERNCTSKKSSNEPDYSNISSKYELIRGYIRDKAEAQAGLKSSIENKLSLCPTSPSVREEYECLQNILSDVEPLQDGNRRKFAIYSQLEANKSSLQTQIFQLGNKIVLLNYSILAAYLTYFDKSTLKPRTLLIKQDMKIQQHSVGMVVKDSLYYFYLKFDKQTKKNTLNFIRYKNSGETIEKVGSGVIELPNNLPYYHMWNFRIATLKNTGYLAFLHGYSHKASMTGGHTFGLGVKYYQYINIVKVDADSNTLNVYQTPEQGRYLIDDISALGNFVELVVHNYQDPQNKNDCKKGIKSACKLSESDHHILDIMVVSNDLKSIQHIPSILDLKYALSSGWGIDRTSIVLTSVYEMLTIMPSSISSCLGTLPQNHISCGTTIGRSISNGKVKYSFSNSTINMPSFAFVRTSKFNGQIRMRPWYTNPDKTKIPSVPNENLISIFEGTEEVFSKPLPFSCPESAALPKILETIYTDNTAYAIYLCNNPVSLSDYYIGKISKN